MCVARAQPAHYPATSGSRGTVMKRNQTAATRPTGPKRAKKKGPKSNQPGEKVAAPRTEKRKQKRSTPAQRKAVRVKASGFIERYGLEMCAADNQQYLQHTKQEMSKLKDVQIGEFLTEGDAEGVRKARTKVWKATKTMIQANSEMKKQNQNAYNNIHNPQQDPQEKYQADANRTLCHNMGYAAATEEQSLDDWQPMLFSLMSEFLEMAHSVREKLNFKDRIAAKADEAGATEKQKQELLGQLKNACNNNRCEMEPKASLKKRQVRK